MLKIEKYQKGYECMKNAENAHQRHTFSHEHPLKITQSKKFSNICINRQQEKEKKTKNFKKKKTKTPALKTRKISSQTQKSFK